VKASARILLRGNTIMDGYFDNPGATAACVSRGWFNTGDLAVRHPDGYVEIKDRARTSSSGRREHFEHRDRRILYRHPAVLEAAVVARPDPRWGETPCAFVRCATMPPRPRPPIS
jgi:fatty-acyl-CoA synthase